MQKRWILSPQDPELAHTISHSHQLSLVLSQVLVNRRITNPEQIERFLKPSLIHLPDPFLLKGMEKAVSRLVKAVREKEPITIYGDYDVDGTTSTTLMMDFFETVGAKVDYYIPHRMREGYSINAGALKKLHDRGTKVIITVDNGISAQHEAKIAKELGIDLIITDHHEVPDQLPDAYTIINPKQKGDEFPGKELAGVGVAFYLLIGLRKALREANLLKDREPNLRQCLDLVAVGTVADMAPLVGINRILVREGLQVMSSAPRLGLKALMEAAGVEGEVRADQIAFRIGPRINAAGRLDDAALGVKLLLCQNKEQAKELAQKLNAANEERQKIEEDIVAEAMSMIETQTLHQRYRSLVVCCKEWHPGVVGIVASRLVEKFHLPSIVLTKEDMGLKGSARSIRGLHLVESLKKCSDLLNRFGGHEYAAGLSLKEENLPAFVERFDQVVRSQLGEEDFSPSLKVDVESALDLIDPSLLEQFKWLEPFGMGNPKPILMLRSVTVHESRVVGEKHLKLKIGEGSFRFGTIGFRMAEKIPPLNSQIDLAFVPEWNEWNGSKNIQLRMEDLRSSSPNAMRK